MKDEAFRLDIPLVAVSEEEREQAIRVLHKRCSTMRRHRVDPGPWPRTPHTDGDTR